MYLAPLKTGIVLALRHTFDQQYPTPDFRDIKIDIEYPVAKEDYPSVWVEYADTQSVRNAGVSHTEYTLPNAEGSMRTVGRWTFAGQVTFTALALTSLERDRLYDELVRVMAFGRDTDAPIISEFRREIESNDLIAMNFDFDEVMAGGDAATPGTPWGTDEIIYERSFSMEVQGEFVSDGSTGTLVSLTAIQVFEQDAEDPSDPTNVPAPPVATWV